MGGDGKGKWPMRVRAVEWTGVNKELLKTRNRVVDGNSSISHSASIGGNLGSSRFGMRIQGAEGRIKEGRGCLEGELKRRKSLCGNGTSKIMIGSIEFCTCSHTYIDVRASKLSCKLRV